MSNQNNKKVLAEQLKAKLNSPEYVAMPDLITYNDRYANMLVWFGKKGWISGTNINPEKVNEYKSEHIVSNEELEEDDFEENNNEIISFEQIDNNSEIRNVKNYLQITNQKSLNLQQLQGFTGSPISTQTDYTPYLIEGGIVFGLGLLGLCYLVGKKYRHK